MRRPLEDWYILFICFVIAAMILFFTQGCSSTEHRRKALQEEHPDCYVFEDLNIECPNPFIEFDSSAGFGTSIETKKPNKKIKRKD